MMDIFDKISTTEEMNGIRALSNLGGETKLHINFVSNVENGIFWESFAGVCFVLSYLMRNSIRAFPPCHTSNFWNNWTKKISASH